jgi:hypothetical protein
MAPPGWLELRDRMCPNSALQDCAQHLCRVSQSQSLVLSGAPSHCLDWDLLAVLLFIFHLFEKHLLSIFYVPSGGLGAESAPGTLLYAPRNTHIPGPKDLALNQSLSNKEPHVITLNSLSKRLFWSFFFCFEKVPAMQLSNPLSFPEFLHIWHLWSQHAIWILPTLEGSV